MHNASNNFFSVYVLKHCSTIKKYVAKIWNKLQISSLMTAFLLEVLRSFIWSLYSRKLILNFCLKRKTGQRQGLPLKCTAMWGILHDPSSKPEDFDEVLKLIWLPRTRFYFAKTEVCHRDRKKPELAWYLAIRDKKKSARPTVFCLWHACLWTWWQLC